MKNKRLKRHVLNASCGVLIGDRGAGKSTLFALIADTYLNEGYDVYCQYPYKQCYQIPLVESEINGVHKFNIDKDWLYSANLSHACVLIDEARTVWPARSYSKWTISDDEFFNFLRKNDTHLFLATQAYDVLDLNIRRAADETYYLSKEFLHFTFIEASHTTLAKVADKNTEVIGRAFKKGMYKVSYDICEVASGDFWFWRRPWYNKFISTHTFYEKPFKNVPLWESIIDFDKLQEEQGYIESVTLMDKIKEYLELRKKYNDEEYEEDEEVSEPDEFLGINLNDEYFELDLKKNRPKFSIKNVLKKRDSFQNQDTVEFEEINL